MNYWEECVSQAMDEAGITATQEQIKIVAGSVDVSHENFGMSHGHDVISRNYKSAEALELERLKSEIKKKEDWEIETKPCEECITTGCVKDGWGRDQTCMKCDGKGRYKPMRF